MSYAANRAESQAKRGGETKHRRARLRPNVEGEHVRELCKDERRKAPCDVHTLHAIGARTRGARESDGSVRGRVSCEKAMGPITFFVNRCFHNWIGIFFAYSSIDK